MAGVSGNSDNCSLPLCRTQMLKVAVFTDFPARVAGFDGSKLDEGMVREFYEQQKEVQMS